mmetsp:Transcript_9571/g.22345  ORF Transcript_9571/g.22345 Transcript_9571/m.22345 type:complete len:265 (+) Transcript_9571:674-1468(+)
MQPSIRADAQGDRGRARGGCSCARLGLLARLAFGSRLGAAARCSFALPGSGAAAGVVGGGQAKGVRHGCVGCDGGKRRSEGQGRRVARDIRRGHVRAAGMAGCRVRGCSGAALWGNAQDGDGCSEPAAQPADLTRNSQGSPACLGRLRTCPRLIVPPERHSTGPPGHFSTGILRTHSFERGCAPAPDLGVIAPRPSRGRSTAQGGTELGVAREGGSAQPAVTSRGGVGCNPAIRGGCSVGAGRGLGEAACGRSVRFAGNRAGSI